MSKSWYAFIWGDDPTDVQHYHKIELKHDCLCGDKICAIYADTGEASHPSEPLSRNLLQYINQALLTGQLQPAFPEGTKKYVYLKSSH